MLNSKSIVAVGTGIASLVASHYSDVFLPVTVSISMAVLGGTIGMLYKEKKITIGKIILRTLLSIFFALLIFLVVMPLVLNGIGALFYLASLVSLDSGCLISLKNRVRNFITKKKRRY